MADLKITGLRKEFGGVIALAGVDISIQSDRIVGIIGPNGSGKTTLFNVIAGVHKPTSGRVLWRGKDITGRSAHEIARTGAWQRTSRQCRFQGCQFARTSASATSTVAHAGTKQNQSGTRRKQFLISWVWSLWETKSRAQCPSETFAGSAWQSLWARIRRSCFSTSQRQG